MPIKGIKQAKGRQKLSFPKPSIRVQVIEGYWITIDKLYKQIYANALSAKHGKGHLIRSIHNIMASVSFIDFIIAKMQVTQRHGSAEHAMILTGLLAPLSE